MPSRTASPRCAASTACPIKGGKSVVLKPGGYHVMLLDLKKPLKEGDLLNFTLTFEKAGDIEVEATVEPIGAKGPHGFDSQPTSTDKGPATTSTERPRHRLPPLIPVRACEAPSRIPSSTSSG